VAKAKGRPLTVFSPALLRKALREAGNIVKPVEIAEVLLYAIKDGQAADLDRLHLILLRNGTVQQLLVGPQPSGQNGLREKKFFMCQNNKAKELYDLMPNSTHAQVEVSEGWRQIAK